MTTTYAPSIEGGGVAALLADAPAYIVGVVDAQAGITPRPDLYLGDGDRAEYAQGYADEAAAIGQYGKDGDVDAIFAPVVAEAAELDLFDYDAEADDYADYRADVDFWRHGC